MSKIDWPLVFKLRGEFKQRETKRKKEYVQGFFCVYIINQKYLTIDIIHFVYGLYGFEKKKTAAKYLIFKFICYAYFLP